MKLTITAICFVILIACNEEPAGNANSQTTGTAANGKAINDTPENDTAGNGTGDNQAGDNDRGGDKTGGNNTGANSTANNDPATRLPGFNNNPGRRTCYGSYKNRDTAILSFIQNDTAISGELVYNFYQKDQNKGTITGFIKGDTLVADYRFSSEGSQSTRQVVFLRRGAQLVEGFGDVMEDNGKMVFSSRASLSFDSSMVFRSIDCKGLARGR